MAACFFALGAASVHIADAQGDENAWRRFATAKTLSDPNLPEANRQMYVAGMYDAIAGDALLVQFTKDPKERVLAILDCLMTHSRGSLVMMADWGYSKWSSTDRQEFSGTSVLQTACLREAGLAK